MKEKFDPAAFQAGVLQEIKELEELATGSTGEGISGIELAIMAGVEQLQASHSWFNSRMVPLMYENRLEKADERLEALAQAGELMDRPEVRQALAPVLATVPNEAAHIAVKIIPALVDLVAGRTVQVRLTCGLAAAIALTIARSGRTGFFIHEGRNVGSRSSTQPTPAEIELAEIAAALERIAQEMIEQGQTELAGHEAGWFKAAAEKVRN